MLTIEPATLHEVDDSRLGELAAALTGERLIGARYVTPSGVNWVNYSDLEGVHDVDLRVELITESGFTLELSWATPGREEGLSLALGRDEEQALSELVDVVDVSSHQDWSRVLGGLVGVVAVSFCVHGDGSSIRPWAFRVGLSNGSSVTVALGETDGNLIRYLPDNLVVIFEADTAKRYEITDGLQSAWGSIVPHSE